MKSNSKKILALAIILDLAVVCFCTFVFLKIQKQNQNVKMLEAELLSYDKNGEVFKDIQNAVKQIDPQLQEFNSYFVEPGGEVAFIEMIDSLGKKNNLDINIHSVDLDASVSSSTSKTEILKFDVETKGNWSNSFNFLNSLENLPYKVSISKASLSKNSDEKKNSYWEGQFNFGVLKIK